MRPDDILVLDMLLAARESVHILGSLSREQFDNDRLRQLAVIKSIEIIGEAAARVSQGYQNAHPEIPWREITGMRHRLVHGYFEVNLERVWQTVRESIPRLILLLETLVTEQDS